MLDYSTRDAFEAGPCRQRGGTEPVVIQSETRHAREMAVTLAYWRSRRVFIPAWALEMTAAASLTLPWERPKLLCKSTAAHSMETRTSYSMPNCSWRIRGDS